VTARVVMSSGGIASYETGRRVVEQFGAADVRLVFADTLIEDRDLYRFLLEATADTFGLPKPVALLDRVAVLPEVEDDLDARVAQLAELRADANAALPPLAWIAEGRHPWQVFEHERYIGNTRVDPCSKFLKRELCDAWLAQNRDPQQTVVYIGLDWTERHRFEGQPNAKPPRAGLRDRMAEKGWRYEAPLAYEAPFLTKPQLIETTRARGIAEPRLYTLGFAHNNCGGFCIKAGKAHFERLLRAIPRRYAYHEANETRMRGELGDVSILRDEFSIDGQRGSHPLSMQAFRERILGGNQLDMFENLDEGGCACFFPEP
jgi:hypothetical protein